MTCSYFSPGCLLQTDPALLRAMLLHHPVLPCFREGWRLRLPATGTCTAKQIFLPSGFFPFPFKNLQVMIFPLSIAILVAFSRRWSAGAVRVPAQSSAGCARGRARAWGSWKPSSATDCTLGKSFNLFVLHVPSQLSA